MAIRTRHAKNRRPLQRGNCNEAYSSSRRTASAVVRRASTLNESDHSHTSRSATARHPNEGGQRDAAVVAQQCPGRYLASPEAHRLADEETSHGRHIDGDAPSNGRGP